MPDLSVDFSSASGTSTPNNESVGLSDPRLLQDGRQMLDLVNRLHNTGVNVDIDLPLIAVIGQQSAGKSSLIESISGITLPRAAGTCTRCPTECRLFHSPNEWNCKVSIRTVKGDQTSVKQFGNIITSKSEVEDRIRRAQWAILSPAVVGAHGVEYFLNGDKHGENAELTFSTNLVSLEISGPDVADLSFCDLPGLIAGVGQAGNTGDIDLVKSLVTSYIQRPSCIILLTVACETDFQNQGAQELAKAHDPLGKRTIGVLTKPDRIPIGEEDIWFSLIRNEREPLDNGWYCVKQPSSSQINKGITWIEARQREAEFFEGSGAWQNLDPIYKRYLRTENLVDRLSSVLSDLISRRLPEIQSEIDKTIISLQDTLKALPKPPSSDPKNEISTLLYTFVRDLSNHMQGIAEEGIIQAIRPAQEQFRRAIRATSPEFQPFYKHQEKILGQVNFLEGEEEHFESVSDEASNEESQDAAEGCSRPTGREIYIDEVMDRANQARTRELPGNFPYSVQQSYIKLFVNQWQMPAKMLCQSVGRMLEDYVQNLVREHFHNFGQGLLEQRVRMLIQNHLRKCEERTAERVEWLFGLENEPFTLNFHYFADYRERFLALYRAERESDRNPVLTAAIDGHRPDTDSGIAKVLASLSEIGVHGIKPEDLANLIEKDGTESALTIMSDVRAYFQVAYKRFVDNIPLAIDYELIRGIERDILQTLNVGLEINGPNGHQICKGFARESSTAEARRKELGGKLERMYAAREQLYRIGRST